MKYQLSLRMSWDKVAKKEIEADSRAELDKKIAALKFWKKNERRITIERKI